MYPLAIISYSDNGFWIQQHSVRIHNQAVQFKCPASKKTKLVNTVDMDYVYKSAICDTLLWKKITTQKHIYIKQYVEEPKVATVWGAGFDRKLSRVSVNETNGTKL